MQTTTKSSGGLIDRLTYAVVAVALVCAVAVAAVSTALSSPALTWVQGTVQNLLATVAG